MGSINKGMVLCAGLGTRLSPITQSVPKPAVPVLNIPSVVWVLDRLSTSGIEKIIVNIHHLSAEVRALLGNGKNWGLKIEYSEEPILLGTGGGVRKAQDFFEKEPFVLANCDYVTNANLSSFIDTHLERKALATMLLYQDHLVQPYYPTVGIGKDDKLTMLPKCKLEHPLKSGIFTGMHLIDSSVLKYLPMEFCGINNILYPILMQEFSDRTFGQFLGDFFWYDTGDWGAYWLTSMELLKRLQGKDAFLTHMLDQHDFKEVEEGMWLHKEAKLFKEVEYSPPCVIGKDSRIGKGSHVGPYVVMGHACRVSEGITIRHSVLLHLAKLSRKKEYDQATVFEQTAIPATRRPSWWH